MPCASATSCLLDVARRRDELLHEQLVSKRCLASSVARAKTRRPRAVEPRACPCRRRPRRFERDLCRAPPFPTAASRASIAVVAMACFCPAMDLRHQHAIAAVRPHLRRHRCPRRRRRRARRLDDAVEARDHAHARRLRDASCSRSCRPWRRSRTRPWARRRLYPPRRSAAKAAFSERKP